MYNNRDRLEISFSSIPLPVLLPPTVLPVARLMPFYGVARKRALCRKRGENIDGEYVVQDRYEESTILTFIQFLCMYNS
jgi:hypothetical protein